jgi:hypothetical protein
MKLSTGLKTAKCIAAVQFLYICHLTDCALYMTSCPVLKYSYDVMKLMQMEVQLDAFLNHSTG